MKKICQLIWTLKNQIEAYFGRTRNEEIFRHTGSDAGVFAFVSFNPTTKIGRVMTLNASLEGGENKKTVGYFKKIIEELDKFEGSLK